MQKEACGCVSCKDGGVIPDSGFPRVDGMANEERARNKRARCKHIVHLIHARASHRGRLGLYLRSVRFGAVQVRYDVEEVVVHGSSWEVVVHVATVVEVVVLVAVVEVVVHGGGGSCSGSWRVVV